MIFRLTSWREFYIRVSVQPVEYRADLVVLLLRDKPVLGIVVEVQLSPDARKQYVWPAYAASLRAQLECQVHVLVVTASDAVARWAAKPVNMGGGNTFTPMVIGPAGVPEIVHEHQAQADPELAVLSAWHTVRIKMQQNQHALPR